MLFLLLLVVLATILRVSEAQAIAMHQLVVVPPAGEAVIRLLGFNGAKPSPKMTYDTSPPSSGSLYQLSQVYSAYGYEPKKGTLIDKAAVRVTGSNNRVYYKRPVPDAAHINKWGTFTYTTSAGTGNSQTGTVTLVPPSGALVGSDFLLDRQAWTVTGNKAAKTDAVYEAFSRGPLLNHYIYSTDNKINVNSVGTAGYNPPNHRHPHGSLHQVEWDMSTAPSGDKSLWYFEAPAAYTGNQGIAYGGSLKFTLGAFSGDFSKLNPDWTSLVELECKTCPGPVSMGITLSFPISAFTAISGSKFTGDATVFTIPLLEGKGWLKDPQNVLSPWITASKCDVISVLSRLSALRILGDWTTWYESVALDDVGFFNTVAQLPLCAMTQNDASVCTC